NRPNLSFLDTTVTPGTTYNYRIRVTDPKGNVRTGDPVTVTASGGAGVSDYDKAVLADGPSAYWPMGESSGTTVTDYAGSDNATKGATVTQGVTGAIPSDVGTAYRFPGTVNTSTVGSTALRTGPMIFSAEAWFKTTSTRGGKIIGFGKSASGNSANSDRHIYMSNAGKIYFGVNPGAIKTVNSTASYNNGQWHHVVGTLGTGGMSLYVDGQLVGSRTDAATAQVFNGYWRVGGDYLFGWPDNPTTGYLTGDIDQAAVYPEVLSPTQVQAHYGLASTAPNVAPTAAFTATPTGLAVAVDGSGSTDTDGTVASYAWDFGDDSFGTGATASHTYTADGTYAIKLTVTDDDGATATATKNVDVVRGNDAPTASFTATTNELAAAFDASASSDSDGTVADYAWDFGDGETGTGVSPNHTYTAGGTFAVKLTVTDDDGATGTQTKNVTVAPAPPVDAPFVSDDFNRTLASGLGTADVGGAWTVTGGAASYAVNNGAGIVKLATAGVTRNAYLGSTLRDSSDTTLTFSYDKVATGSGVYYNLSGRRVSATEDYRTDFRITNANKVVLSLSALQGSSTATALGSSITLPGTVAPGDQVRVRMQTFGTNSTTIRAKVWWGSADEPSSWTVSATNSYAGLQRTGAIGLTTYLSSSTTNAPLNVSVQSIASKPVTP
ncbi:MAG: PKD domain-containing protein, partial [Propionibacteriaceae bacterium]